MRIDFSSHARPERIAKALRAELARIGHDIRYTQVREATAAMFGYASWNDLLGRAGKSAPSPGDQDAGVAVAAARRTAFVSRLSKALTIPEEAAASAVDAVGPTSGRSFRGFDLEAALRRMAKGLAASGGSAWVDGDTVVARTTDPRGSEEHRFAVGPDGAVSGPDTGLFGRVLQEAGLGAYGDAEGQEVPEALRRLDARALRRLRACYGFEPSLYERVRRWPEDHPFGRLLDELPLLAAELTTLRMLRYMAEHGRDPEGVGDAGRLAAVQEAMIESGDPMGAIVDMVRENHEREFPCLPFDAAKAEAVLRAMGRHCIVLEELFGPRHITVLSLGPPEAVPRTASEAEAAIRFINRRHGLFRPYSALRPDGFFAEFDGSWERYAQAAEGEDLIQERAFDEVAGTLALAAASRLGRPPREAWDYEEDDVLGIVAARVGTVAMEGKGFMSLLAYARGWADARRAVEIRAGDGGATPGEMMGAVLLSGILPDGIVDRDPLVVLGRLGFDPVRLLDALTDQDGAEASLEEVERRVSVGHGDAYAPYFSGHLLVGSRAFHQVEIGGVTFTGELSDRGPCLRARSPDGTERAVLLTGESAPVYMHNQDYEGWAIPGPGEPIGVKVDGESVFDLAREFGLGDRDRPADFGGSPAFEGLCRYVRSHPRLAEACTKGLQPMSGWYEAALDAGCGVEAPGMP